MHMYFASSFSNGCWLPTNSSIITFSMIQVSHFCECFDQLIGVHAACALLNWYFWVLFSLLQWFLTMFTVFLLYFSALHTFLARVQGFSLIATMHNSTAFKVRGVTKDIFICSSFFWSPDTKKPMFTSKFFLSLFSHLQKHTNPTILIDAKQ